MDDASEKDQRARLELEVADACRASPEGADFLISSFVQSLRSYRRPTVCAPFPAWLHRHSGFSAPNVSTSQAEDKDFSSAEDCLAHLPPVQNLLASSFTQLSRVPFRSLRLLHWILSGNRQLCLVSDPSTQLGHLLAASNDPWRLQALSEDADVASRIREGARDRARELMPHAVLKVTTARGEGGGSEEEEGGAFKEARAKLGSVIAFHGTSAENLHSILRCGLVSMSGTRLQKNGAIFGEGIYLSTEPSVALSFSSAGEGWERSCFGMRARYLLVCEVVKDVAGVQIGNCQSEVGSSSEAPSVPGTYVLVTNCELLKMRYIFVYMEQSRSSSRVETFRVDRGTASTRGGGDLAAVSVGNALEQAQSARGARVDWCKAMIVAYVALLLGVGFLNSDAYRYGRLPPFLDLFGP